jgi:hypothetical protein
MELMQHSLLVKLGERKRKQLLLEEITIVKNSFSMMIFYVMETVLASSIRGLPLLVFLSRILTSC